MENKTIPLTLEGNKVSTYKGFEEKATTLGKAVLTAPFVVSRLVGMGVSAPYAFPLLVSIGENEKKYASLSNEKKEKALENWEEKLSIGTPASCLCGFLPHLFISMWVANYFNLDSLNNFIDNHSFLYIFGIPFLTNLVFGIYEGMRYSKIKEKINKGTLGQEPEGKGLEGALSP